MRIKWFFFEQIWIPFTQGCFVPSLVEIGPVVLEKKIHMWKVYDNDNDGNDDDDGQRTNFDQKCSLRLGWAKKLVTQGVSVINTGLEVGWYKWLWGKIGIVLVKFSFKVL